MKLKVIKTKKEYQAYLDWVDVLLDKKVTANSPEGEELQVALLLIKQYEDIHFLIPFIVVCNDDATEQRLQRL